MSSETKLPPSEAVPSYHEAGSHCRKAFIFSPVLKNLMPGTRRPVALASTSSAFGPWTW
jgi:hypothetical protein